MLIKILKNTIKEKNKLVIVFDDMVTDLINNKKPYAVLTELFISGRKVSTSLAFITQSYFKVSKNVKLNCTHLFIMKIPNKRELSKSFIRY